MRRLLIYCRSPVTYPKSLWKLQKWLGVGKEKKLSKDWDAFDHFIYPCIALKQEKQIKTNKEDLGFDGLIVIMEAYQATSTNSSGNSKLGTRDVILNLILAGRDTTSTAFTWFFWLLATDPSAEDQILNEIEKKLQSNRANIVGFPMWKSRINLFTSTVLCVKLSGHSDLWL